MTTLSRAYIYPQGAPTDVLNFLLYPDSGEISLGSGGGSNPHPSYGHSVKQLTGRMSPTFSFSLIFEGVSHSFPTRAGSQAGNLSTTAFEDITAGNSSTAIAHNAFKWFMRNVGPEGNTDFKDEAQQFVMKLWDSGSRLVSLDRVKITPLIVSRAARTENLVRRFRADVQGEYIYPVQVDQSIFKKRVKGKGKKKAATEKTTPAPAAAPAPKPPAAAPALVVPGVPKDPDKLTPSQRDEFIRKAFPPPPTARPSVTTELRNGQEVQFRIGEVTTGFSTVPKIKVDTSGIWAANPNESSVTDLVAMPASSVMNKQGYGK